MTVHGAEPADRAESGKALREKKSFGRRRDYAGTFVTEFSVMLSQVVLYKLAAAWLGQTGFSEYALARRVVALLQPMVMLGMGVGLPRYLALADGRGREDRSAQYLWATLLCVGGFTAASAFAFLMWPSWFSYLFFGDAQHEALMVPLLLMLIGMTIHAIVYAFLRGKLAVRWANTLQGINLGVLPVGLFLFFHKSAADFLLYLGLGWTSTAAIALMFTPLRHGWKNPSQESRQLLSYGLQRVPGDFALLGLLSLPAIFAAHLLGIRQAGLVAFGLAIVNMIAFAFSPVGIILLPKVSRAIGSGDFRHVHREIVLIIRVTLALSSVFVVLVEVFGGRLIQIYLGKGFGDARGLVNTLAVGAVPLAYYYVLRNVIDASHHKAVNAINVIIALFLYLAGSGVGVWFGSPRFLLGSCSTALVVLALLTRREIRKVLKAGGSMTPGADSPLVMETAE